MTTITAATAPIWEALRGVLDPELGENVVDLGMIKDVAVRNGVATIQVALTIAACPLRDQIENDVVRKVEALPTVDSVKVDIVAMSQDERTALMERVRLRARENAGATQVHPTTRVIAVSSGKGGVGKSSVSVNLALALADLGHEVGLLDADIWGFSIPRMVGATGQSLAANQDRVIEPAQALGISVVSTGLIVEDEETALMWRGLMLSKALEQFLRDVGWSPSLDYLIIDMPPGTGDVQMALARLLPQAEMVVVTTPQKAAQKVASRVADMARRSHMPVIRVSATGQVSVQVTRADILAATSFTAYSLSAGSTYTSSAARCRAASCSVEITGSISGSAWVMRSTMTNSSVAVG